MEFQITAEGKDVVIIGGGDTGADCLGTATRQGARSVTQLEIMPRPTEERPDNQPWPTYPAIFRVASAQEEFGDRLYALSTTRFTGDTHGRVAGLDLVEVAFSDGKFNPVELGEAHSGPTGAVGDGLHRSAARGPGRAVRAGAGPPRGNIARNGDFETSEPGVFVCGDAGRGQSLIVWAIAEGRSCAAGVDKYLTGGNRSCRVRSSRPIGR